ncbi:MAG: Csu type fimbrial protein [Gammaproteobacteria bacterium]
MKSMQSNVRNFLAAWLAVAVAVSGAGVRATTTTSNLNVSASVTANCTISTTPLAFGEYDPIVANRSVPLNGEGAVTTICTKGSAPVVTLGQGANPAAGSSDATPLRQMASGDSRLPYFLYQEAGRTLVWGNTPATGKGDTGTGLASTLTVYGQIPANQFKPAGSYADTVVATVTF